MWGGAGIILGIILHLTVILALPLFSKDSLWRTLSALGPVGEVATLEPVVAGQSNNWRLDPALVYAVCRFDLSRGPGVLSGPLPEDFWSIGVFGRDGSAIYSTTSRSGVGKSLELGIFNPTQTRLLAEQQIELQEGLLIIEAQRDDVFAVVRLAPPHPVARDRYEELLRQLTCGHISEADITSDI